MLDWFKDHPAFVSLIAIGSAIFFIVSLLAMPFIVSRIPADYFAHRRRPPSRFAKSNLALRLTVMIARNLLAAVLLLAGLAMLLLPGQGLLTLFAGFLLIDLPGKYRLERWLVSKPWVHRPINWLRAKRGREPLQVMESATK